MGTPFLRPCLLSPGPAEKLGDSPDCPPYSWVSRSCSGSWKVTLSWGTFQERPQPTDVGSGLQPHLPSSHLGSHQGEACEKLAAGHA